MFLPLYGLALAVSSPVRLHGCAAVKHGLALAVGSLVRLHGCAAKKHRLAANSLVRSSALAQQRHDHFGTYRPRRRPASATRNQTSSCTYLLLDQHQLSATIIQLHLFTTQPTSDTRNDRLAASLRPQPYQLPTTTN